MASHLSSLSFFLLFNLASIHVFAGLVFEDGYTVTTVLDGDKLRINPHSVLPRSGSSDLIILDTSANAFYTVSFPTSQESVIKRFAGNGNGKDGFSDGDSGSAMFRKPKSFAVDLKGNVYVADKTNHAIRKISKSGVTTIAGGYSQTAGKVDGPAQNASFSTDFELTFVPERCALMISDHGNRLVRQINLKPEDCARGSQSVLGMASAWILGLGASCLLGLIIGFAIRPYIYPHTGRLQPPSSQQDMEAFPNQSGETSTDVLLRHQKRNYDLSSNEITESQMFADQLKDLISLDGGLELSDTTNKLFEPGDENKERTDVLSDRHGKIDNMMQSNIMGFAEQAQKTSPLAESLVSSSGLVRRR